jgi:hypothetical protein
MVKTSTDGSGVFNGRGDAENARNRLKTERVPEDRMMLKVLPRALPLRPILPGWVRHQTANNPAGPD